MTNSLSIQKKLLLLTLLTSVTTLTACGQKEAQTVPASKASAAAKVISKSSSSATAITGKPSSSAIAVTTPSTLAEAEVGEEVTEASSEEVVVQEETVDAQTETEATPEVASHATQGETADLPTTFDLNALSSGDYSSIAGTWANAKGWVFTVTAEGVLYFGEAFDDNAHHKIEEARLNNNGRVGGSLGFYRHGERAGGAVIVMVPAGVANVNDLVGDLDHIEIGHDISSGYPEEQFFRQSSQ